MGKADGLRDTEHAHQGRSAPGNPSRMQEELNEVTGGHSEGNAGASAPPAPTPTEAGASPAAGTAPVSPAVSPGASPDAAAGKDRAEAHNP